MRIFVEHSTKLILAILSLSVLGAQAQVDVSLPENPSENQTVAKIKDNTLEITWPVENQEVCRLILDLEKNNPLFKQMSIGKPDSLKEIVSEVDPTFILNVGQRTLNPENGWTIFFDRVPTRPYQSYALELEKTEAKVVKKGARTMISIGELNAPDVTGHLEITVYNGSPLFNIAAEIVTQKDSVALLYDVGLVGNAPWETVAFENNEGEFMQTSTDGSTITKDNAVRYRTIIGQNEAGAIAVFPPPHQYFYPLDEAYNLNSTWHGQNYRNMVTDYGIGIRQEPEGDHRFVPWFNAPPGTSQRLNFFCLLGSNGAEQVLESIKKYTRDDRYISLEGFKTMASHFHNEFIMNVVMAGKPIPEKPEFVDVFKRLGVDIVHLGEFHYTAHPKGPDDQRLKELDALFTQCARLSDKEFLLLPGEEPNEFLGGHWMQMFPKPVYWIMSRDDDKSYATEDLTYGKVYRIGNADEMLQLLQDENGLAWTAHARIKGSTGYPDKYKNEVFFKSDHFLGAAWKSMPADLSTPKLGLRVLDLLDDMNNWGLPKKAIAESDLFTVSFENEMYAHMNVNYLQIDVLPKFEEGWQPVVDAMSQGKFFSTTGEILIPSFTVNGKGSGETIQLDKKGKANIAVEIDWTFPLNFAEIISGDGEKVFREKVDLNETAAFGSQLFERSVDLSKRKWVRLEVWDVAANGAFTQTVYLEE